ncbi:hypothetical protein FOB64_001039 [Candida albicans]|uniref:Uncharacterized protein n=1 Tax=Candida albicans TaxID=5476 RepID=A0A8H6F556_CANAX|nr:hypothetical protein FOB64_001039 [Candida albicans]
MVTRIHTCTKPYAPPNCCVRVKSCIMYIREDYPQLSTNVKENNRDLEFVANNVRSALIGTNGLSESKSVSIDTSGKTPNKNPLNTKLKNIIIKLQRLLPIRKLLYVKKRTLSPKEKTLQVDTDFINTNDIFEVPSRHVCTTLAIPLFSRNCIRPKSTTCVRKIVMANSQNSLFSNRSSFKSIFDKKSNITTNATTPNSNIIIN